MRDTDIPKFYLLNAGYAVHHADWNYKDVNSPFARIYLVTEGEATLHISSGESHRLLPGHLYFIPPFTPHSYQCEGLYALYYIHIYETASAGRLFFEDYIYPTEADAGDYERILVEHLLAINPHRELKQYDPKSYDNSSTLMHNIAIDSQNPLSTTLNTRGILYQLLARFAELATEKYRTTDDRIKKVLRLIRRDIDKDIEMEKDDGDMLPLGSPLHTAFQARDRHDARAIHTPQEDGEGATAAAHHHPLREGHSLQPRLRQHRLLRPHLQAHGGSDARRIPQGKLRQHSCRRGQKEIKSKSEE